MAKRWEDMDHGEKLESLKEDTVQLRQAVAATADGLHRKIDGIANHVSKALHEWDEKLEALKKEQS